MSRLDSPTLHNRIERLRKDLGLSQPEFAAQLGMEAKKGRSTINNWESGANRVKDDDLKNIATTFNVSADWLLGIPGATKSQDISMQAVCKYTGLTEEAIDNLLSLSDGLVQAVNLILKAESFPLLIQDVEELITELSEMDSALDDPRSLVGYTITFPRVFQLEHLETEVEMRLRNVRYLNYQAGRTLEKLLNEIAAFNRVEEKAISLQRVVAKELDKLGTEEERETMKEEYEKSQKSVVADAIGAIMKREEDSISFSLLSDQNGVNNNEK